MSAFVRPGKLASPAAVSAGACVAPAGFAEKFIEGSMAASQPKFCSSTRALLLPTAVVISVFANRPPPELTNAANSAACAVRASISHEPAATSGLLAMLVPPSNPYVPRASGM
jgi:hypothetical protein